MNRNVVKLLNDLKIKEECVIKNKITVYNNSSSDPVIINDFKNYNITDEFLIITTQDSEFNFVLKNVFCFMIKNI